MPRDYSQDHRVMQGCTEKKVIPILVESSGKLQHPLDALTSS